MNARPAPLSIAAGCLAATLWAACASEAKLPGTSAQLSGPLAASPALAAVAKLQKGLAAARVTELLGPPSTTNPVTGSEIDAQIWSDPFHATTDVRMIPVTTQEFPAINPLTGQPITRTEQVYQNQSVDVTDTLHLLMVDGLLTEWRIIRDTKKRFE